MLLTIIGILVFFQILAYIVADQFNAGQFKGLILTALLFTYVFVLPPWCCSRMLPEGPKCGNPGMGITLVFWVIGGGLAIATHLVYSVFKSKHK